MEQQFLLPGDYVTTRKPMHLATLLGSCVSVCLTNVWQRTAGMNHYMLPEAAPGGDAGRYGDTAIHLIVKALFALDADPKHYRARVYGGGKVIGHLGAFGEIGNRNIEMARALLHDLGIVISHQDVGGSRGRRIDFNTSTGVIDCRQVGVDVARRTPAARNARVLIVDDSALARGVIKEGLTRCEGISIVGEASSAFEARDQILSLDPDVLTLAAEMPQIDGISFLRQLMKHLPKPVVVMSTLAKPGSELESRARAAGAFEVFDKGRFESSQGLDVVRQVLAPILRRAALSRPGLK